MLKIFVNPIETSHINVGIFVLREKENEFALFQSWYSELTLTNDVASVEALFKIIGRISQMLDVIHQSMGSRVPRTVRNMG